jgi:hypothetical protein
LGGPILGSITRSVPKGGKWHEKDYSHAVSATRRSRRCSARRDGQRLGRSSEDRQRHGWPWFHDRAGLQGKKVTKLKAGTAYRLVISDRSSIHNFHLSGPGFNRVFTGVEYTGTKSFVLRLKKGSYRFVCDPHSGIMHGGFRVS